MRRTENSEIERLEYWEGQLLRADDFSTQQNNDNQRRAWHNRALHDAYGVSLGLAVAQNGRALEVGCGLAHDCEGRELLVPVPARIPIPGFKPGKPGSAPDPRLLVIRWRDYAGHPSPAECDPCSTTARTADFGWVRMPNKNFTFDGRLGVPLALVNFDTTGNPTLDDTFEQPQSRPVARPRLGSGITPPGGTVWELWKDVAPGVVASPQTLGLQTKVDTSASGFTGIPVYIAQLQIVTPRSLPFLLPICRVDEAAPDSFVFRVWLPRVQSQSALAFTVPSSQITDISDTGLRVHLKSVTGFKTDDPICRVSKVKPKPGSSVIKKINDDDPADPFIDIDPAIEGLSKKDKLRLAYIPSLKRVQAFVDALNLFPRMELQIDGLDADTGAPVSGRFTVVVAADGSFSVTPPLPKLKIDDTPPTVPLIAIVNAQPLDFPLVIENLGWHVCWLGAVCESGPSITCTTPVCEISAEEVCGWQS